MNLQEKAEDLKRQIASIESNIIKEKDILKTLKNNLKEYEKLILKANELANRTTATQA